MSGFLHDRIDDRDCKTSKDGWQGTESNIWNVILRVAVTDVLEVEMAIVTYEPTSETKQHLGKRWVHIEIVFSSEIVRSKLSKVYFVEAGKVKRVR